MLHRFLTWRLLFEVSNVRRLFGHGPERINYLAFGANLSDEILLGRCIKPLDSQPFSLRDHGLRFDHPAAWANCAYASAEHAPGEVLHGFLYTLSGRDAARMDFYESVPILGRYKRIYAEQDGIKLYYYRTNRATPGLCPTEEYLGYIVEGLRQHPGVDPDYLEQITALETAVPGALVNSYLSAVPEQRSRLTAIVVDSYHRMALWFHFKVIYWYSPTAWLIRRQIRHRIERK